MTRIWGRRRWLWSWRPSPPNWHMWQSGEGRLAGEQRWQCVVRGWAVPPVTNQLLHRPCIASAAPPLPETMLLLGVHPRPPNTLGRPFLDVL